MLAELTIIALLISGADDMRSKGYKNPTPARNQKMSALARAGRFGDSELAHVNPREKAILMALGGSGTTNPRTGLREFFDGSETSVTDYGESFGPPEAAPQYDSPIGPSPGPELSPVYDSPIGPTPGPELSPVYDAPIGPPAPGSRQGAAEGIMGILGRLGINLDPRTQMGARNLMTVGAPAPFGIAMRGLESGTRALGNTVGRAINDTFGGTALPVDMSFPDAGGGNSADLVGAALGAQPSAQPIPQWMRPGSMEAPGELASLGVGPGMSDIQQRALISTYGTQGVNSSTRSDAAKRYYANLMARNLIGDNNRIVSPMPQVLPIEEMYLKSVYGQAPDMTNPEAILNALKGYY